MAERAGFEPAVPFGTHALQACALGRTTLPLRVTDNVFNPSACDAADYTTNCIFSMYLFTDHNGGRRKACPYRVTILSIPMDDGFPRLPGLLGAGR